MDLLIDKLLTIAERFGVPVALSVGLIFIMWRLGNRLVNAHVRFLESMEEQGRRDGDSLEAIVRSQAITNEKLDKIVCRYNLATPSRR